ncbi:30S ribosomal protein S20 [Balneolaceae bacterium ANBcel3]|nr:30S ribosomal protein S20 [Balneolaceae bacterium ANBcel3]
MPQHKSAEKRVRQSAKLRLSNREKRSKMRSLARKVLESNEKEAAQALLPDAISYIDRLACKGLLHSNNAANKKSRLVRHVNKLGESA